MVVEREELVAVEVPALVAPEVATPAAGAVPVIVGSKRLGRI
jgi:hypothetical protein